MRQLLIIVGLLLTVGPRERDRHADSFNRPLIGVERFYFSDGQKAHAYGYETTRLYIFAETFTLTFWLKEMPLRVTKQGNGIKQQEFDYDHH